MYASSKTSSCKVAAAANFVFIITRPENALATTIGSRVTVEISPFEIKTIVVKDRDGKTVNFYAPNHIGSKEQELKDKAQKEADKIGGTVHINY
jgi:hypothetical protein